MTIKTISFHDVLNNPKDYYYMDKHELDKLVDGWRTYFSWVSPSMDCLLGRPMIDIINTSLNRNFRPTIDSQGWLEISCQTGCWCLHPDGIGQYKKFDKEEEGEELESGQTVSFAFLRI